MKVFKKSVFDKIGHLWQTRNNYFEFKNCFSKIFFKLANIPIQVADDHTTSEIGGLQNCIANCLADKNSDSLENALAVYLRTGKEDQTSNETMCKNHTMP